MLVREILVPEPTRRTLRRAQELWRDTPGLRARPRRAVPPSTGLGRREKGLAKSDNARVRRGLIQLGAGGSSCSSKDSALVQWYRARVETGARKTNPSTGSGGRGACAQAAHRVVALGEVDFRKDPARRRRRRRAGRENQRGHDRRDPARHRAAAAGGLIDVVDRSGPVDEPHTRGERQMQGCGARLRPRWRAADNDPPSAGSGATVSRPELWL